MTASVKGYDPYGYDALRQGAILLSSLTSIILNIVAIERIVILTV